MSKVYTIQEVENLLKEREAFLLDAGSIQLNDETDPIPCEKITYGSSKNFILLFPNKNKIDPMVVLQRVTKDGVIVEGNTAEKTFWQVVR